MKSLQCLNCEETAERNYCSNCGQKTDTHRITLKHFLFHDIVHGVWHMEKGILFTLKQALFRPGKAAMAYIEGKRIRYYNIFYLILLLIGLGIFIESIYTASLAKYVAYNTEDIIQHDSEIKKKSLEFFAKYAKLFLISAIPAYAFNSFILFNKRKLLYSEHLILFGMFFLGVIIITLIGNILFFAGFIKSISFLADWSNTIVPLLLFPYIVNGLYGAFGKDYTRVSFTIRAFIYFFLIIAEVRLVGEIVKFYLRHYHH